MKVRCISEYPSENQLTELGESYARSHDRRLVQGREYTVHELYFVLKRPGLKPALYLSVDVEPEFNYYHSYPLCLFEIIDPRISRHWQIRYFNNEVIVLAHSVLLKDELERLDRSYNPDSVAVKKAVEDFQKARELIETEFLAETLEKISFVENNWLWCEDCKDSWKQEEIKEVVKCPNCGKIYALVK